MTRAAAHAALLGVLLGACALMAIAAAWKNPPLPVPNPIDRLTGALHVYGGDFFDPVHRSEWDAETLLEQPWDPQRAVARFEDANVTIAKC
jgi:hypothetical protein